MCISTESSACSSTSASPNLPTSPSSQVATFRKCTLCPRIAYTTNYNLLTCDACKMFFRRIVILNKSYTCKYENRCRASGKSLVIACKACRFRQCTDAGMMFRPNFSEVQTPEPSELEAFVRNVVWLDARRGKNMKFKFTDEDFSLSDVLENRPMKLVTRKTEMSQHDWSFWGIYTSVEFLLGFEFMEQLDNKDKLILLRSFCVKASLFAGAMRAKREGRDRLMTVDGRDVYPDNLKRLEKFPEGLLHRIRSLLVCRLIELKVTSEEFALVNVILCCNPAVTGLSESAQSILAIWQKKCSSYLFQYCQYYYQHTAPTRFTDLLSLCHVVNRNFEDVQYMTMLFKIYIQGVKYRRIVNEVV